MMTKPRPRRRGYALMLVILEVTLLAALWGIAYRQLTATMRFLIQFNQVNASLSSNDNFKPLARALSLLETGDPPDGGSGVYTCNATILTSSGPAYFIILYQKQPAGSGDSGSSGDTWVVTSTQQFLTSSSEKSTWDTMPPTFAVGN